MNVPVFSALKCTQGVDFDAKNGRGSGRKEAMPARKTGKTGTKRKAGKALGDYEAKRDFAATPEPAPSDAEPAGGESRFAVQEHRARSLHWDLRLEHDGVLASWAVPKGIPPDPHENHLAVHTEDHPLEYLTFEGEIPEGEYGAGTMTVWDAGTYDTHKWTDRKVEVTLHGDRVRGRYALFQTRDRNWMIHRMDPPDDPERTPPPLDLRPMLATLAKELPRRGEWAYEMKWDGIRALALVQGGRIRLTTRNGRDVTAGYPELRSMGEALGATEALLDGEIVAIDEDGHASFQRLQRRMHVTDRAAVARLTKQVPVVYMVFDVCWLDGRRTTGLPYTDRRRLVEALELAGPSWQTPPVNTDDGELALDTSRDLGFEGIIAKRLDSVYEPGRRSSAWLKIKHQLRQEFVVGGWLEGKGNRANRIGALVIGNYDDNDLVYAGKVGTGFTVAELERLARLLDPLARDDSPFTGTGVPKDTHFVEPELVVEVRFTEWTSGGRVRNPAYLGTRDDKDPRDVVREE